MGGKVLGQKGMSKHVATCSVCGISSHTVLPDKKRKIHALQQFDSKTCWEILHSEDGFGLWKRLNNSDSSIRYAPQYTHPVFMELRRQYGKTPTMKRNKKRRLVATIGNSESVFEDGGSAEDEDDLYT